MFKELLLEKDKNIAIITLNRPDKLNALSANLWFTELPRAFSEVEQDDNIRVLIITGAGRGFCSGADIDEMDDLFPKKKPEDKSRRDFLNPLGAYAINLRAMNKPTIAAINGIAVGAGFSLAMACDLRIASEKARFGSAFIMRGLIPDSGLTYFLTRIVGTAKALEIMYTGDIIDAREAEKLGIVNKVVAAEELMMVTGELARKVAERPPIALELTKQAVYKALVNDIDAQFTLEGYSQRICMESDDFIEGRESFIEKRQPKFRGK